MLFPLPKLPSLLLSLNVDILKFSYNYFEKSSLPLLGVIFYSLEQLIGVADRFEFVEAKLFNLVKNRLPLWLEL